MIVMDGAYPVGNGLGLSRKLSQNLTKALAAATPAIIKYRIQTRNFGGGGHGATTQERP
jgi:hypothetical protein